MNVSVLKSFLILFFIIIENVLCLLAGPAEGAAIGLGMTSPPPSPWGGGDSHARGNASLADFLIRSGFK